jgi:hypothetical protein
MTLNFSRQSSVDFVTDCRRSTASDLNKALRRGLFCVLVVLENNRVYTIFWPMFGICFPVRGGDYTLFRILITINKNPSNTIGVYYRKPRSCWDWTNACGNLDRCFMVLRIGNDICLFVFGATAPTLPSGSWPPHSRGF